MAYPYRFLSSQLRMKWRLWSADEICGMVDVLEECRGVRVYPMTKPGEPRHIHPIHTFYLPSFDPQKKNGNYKIDKSFKVIDAITRQLHFFCYIPPEGGVENASVIIWDKRGNQRTELLCEGTREYCGELLPKSKSVVDITFAPFS